MRKITVAASVVLLCGTVAQAQFSSDYRKAADSYFAKGDYASAVEYYEKSLYGKSKTADGFDPYAYTAVKPQPLPKDSQQLIYQLAESWRLLKNYEKAAPLYKKVAENDVRFPLAQYHYATCERALGKYEEAENALHRFLNTYQQKDHYSQAAQREVRNLVFIQEQLRKETKGYAVHTLYEGKTGASYAPVQLSSNTLLFTATWADSAAEKNKAHVNHLYEASFTEEGVGAVSRANIPVSQLHEGAAAISADGSTLYLTRWSVSNHQKSAAIYVSKKTGGVAGDAWSSPVALDSVINVRGANTQQPFVMPDGRHLLYASDRAGGLGGFDLWMAELDAAGKPLSTVNMGDNINTTGNEQAPYYHASSATLVFATDGRTGMGGYDLFYTKGAPGSWAEPQNFGYPVNSVKNDMYFTSYSTGKRILEKVVLSSDRADVCCMELFQLQKANPMKLVVGQVVACDTRIPLAGVAVEVIDTVTHEKIYTGVTSADGSYAFAVKQSLPLSSMAALKGYYTTAAALQLPADADADSLVSVPVCMQKEPEVINEVQVLNNVYYEFNKAEILEKSFASLDDVVAFLNKHPDIHVEIGGHTDNKGSDELNQKLSEARAANVVAYLVGKGIDKNRLTAKGYGATVPVAPNTYDDGTDNPAGREKNRRTEMKVLK
ncbi:OmpA family protein [Filimonas lacunae]|nr:OmpA family protein [Filimonas lacunae]BAV04939.1 outer membrane lipoprotein omp16 precursor [Filimonas lacunae]